MKHTHVLALYFDAPMQSYGVESKFDRRTSLAWPSRSAVTGIVGAALGIDRGDRAFLASFANLAMETFVLKRNGTQN
ncbi:MAG: CRISPR-associated protein Cas5, partial [Planctomycetia bacterium]|nr:CRISPR-associated protein Cas5 [Planctomycetia bacterium]